MTHRTRTSRSDSDSGLRGYSINEFAGQRVFSTQVEARSTPFALWVLRLGGVVFYDVGGAAGPPATTPDTLTKLQLHHDVGLGLRILIPADVCAAAQVRLRGPAQSG